MLSQAGKSKDTVAGAGNELRHFLARHIAQPFIESVSRNKAAAAIGGLGHGRP